MIDNMMTHVKVNNEIDLCEIKSEKARKKVETAMQYAQISYFLRWQEPGFLEKLLFHKSTKVVMCVNRAQLELKHWRIWNLPIRKLCFWVSQPEKEKNKKKQKNEAPAFVL